MTAARGAIVFDAALIDDGEEVVMVGTIILEFFVERVVSVALILRISSSSLDS